MFKKITVFLLLTYLMSSCIREDRSDCLQSGSFRLEFRYTHNNQGQDRLASEVGDIRFYVFNEAGVLVDIIRVSGDQIAAGYVDVVLPEGKYTIVAWAGSGPDLMQGGYTEGDMIDPAANTYTPQATVGVTRLDKFRMMLATDPLAGGTPDDITPQNDTFDDLFFSVATGVRVTPGQNQSVNFDFIKNTSILRITVAGLEYLASYTPVPDPARPIRMAVGDQPLCVFAEGRNERYMYDNLIGANSRKVRYEPPCKTLTATEMVVDIQLQRIDIVQHNEWPILLYIQEAATGGDIVLPIDVLQAILRAKDAGGNLIWTNQNDIDNEDVFPFEISILPDLRVKIIVDGYEITDTDPIIIRP